MALTPRGPKILLLDMSPEAEADFTAHGFQVRVGSLGQPYLVQQSDDRIPVYPGQHLPEGWNESEIVVVDLSRPGPSEEPIGRKMTSDGELDWWVKCSTGIVDPRPRTAMTTQKQFNRIYRHGGAFIIFMDSEYTQDYAAAKIDYYGHLKVVSAIEAHPWSFLSVLHEVLELESDSGLDMHVSDDHDTMASLFGPYITGSRYGCTFDFVRAAARDASAHFLLNKFSSCVGLVTNWQNADGVIILLPQFKSKGELSLSLVNTLLPSLVPTLFPDAASSPWLRSHAYEHPQVLAVQNTIEEKRATHETEVAGLETTIDQIRSERQFLHDLLVASGDELRLAVIQAFQYLGCPAVVDADANGDESSSELGEDIRLEDGSPLLLIETKGIIGGPKDEDCLAVAKYLAPTMKRLNRTDVSGVTVINYERTRPPHERSDVPFRDVVIQAAQKQGVALLTTWELFLLCRGADQHQWSWLTIRPLLEAYGVVRAIPTHYKLIGTVEHVWDEAEALGAKILTGELQVGDTVAIDDKPYFGEGIVQSLQIDDTSVDVASDGDGVGLKLSIWKKWKVGASVYSVFAPGHLEASPDEPTED